MIQTAIDFDAAERRATTGMRRAADHADRVEPGWTERAVEALRQFAKEQSKPFTIEAAREAIASKVPQPPEARAWGAVTRTARARDYIAPAGVALPAASSNGSLKPGWRAGSAA